MVIRILAATLMASLLLASAIVGTASAHVARFESKVKITDFADNASFLGRVSSERKACRRKRLVTVWKRNPGAMDGPVGTARTNRRGIWAVFAPDAESSVYYATAKRRVLRRSASHRHVCKAARSPSFRLRR
jgi:hypothetical protein